MSTLIALAFYLGLLIYFGSRSRAGFASWHMFADLHKIEFDIEVHQADGTWTKLNPWDYLPHTHLNMSREELQFFLHYLTEVHQLKLRGQAIEHSGGKKYLLKIGKRHA